MSYVAATTSIYRNLLLKHISSVSSSRDFYPSTYGAILFIILDYIDLAGPDKNTLAFSVIGNTKIF